MGRVKKVKAKLMKAADARAKVEEQRKWIEHQNLVINRLENDVASLEGARVNLRVMYESATSTTETYAKTIGELRTNIRALQDHNQEIVNFADRRSIALRAYESETAEQVIGRGICMVFTRVRKIVRRLFTRKKNR